MQRLAGSPPKTRSRQRSADAVEARPSPPHIATFSRILHSNLLDILVGCLDVCVRGGSASSPPRLMGRPTTLYTCSGVAICA